MARIRHLFPLALTASIVAAPAAVGAPRQIVPGVTYERLAAGGQVTHVVRINPSPLITVRPERMSTSVQVRRRLTTVMDERRGLGALVGVNGDYFNYTHGYPSGMLMIGSELMHEPEPTRFALGFLGTGRLTPVKAELAGEWTGFDPATGVPATFGFLGMNRSAEARQTLLFTNRFGPRTPTGTNRTDVAVRLDATAPLRANRDRFGTVTAIRPGGGLAPSTRQVILTGVGAGPRARLRTLRLGWRVRLNPKVTGVPANLRHAIGGGPLLVSGGKAIHTTGVGFTFAQVGTRSARSAVGQTASGQLLFVTSEGPLEGSRGMTANQQADQLAALGADIAVAMDSGGSSGIAVNNRLVNRVAYGERAIANAVVVRYAGVQLTDPAALITPNGDGSRETTQSRLWAARSGRAVVTLRTPGGARVRTLYSGPVGPTVRTLHLTGAGVGDGNYLVSAQFRPSDGSRASHDTSPIAIDRTLGALALSKVGKAPRTMLRVGYRLRRSAPVTIVVRNARGRALIALMRRQPMPAGAHAGLWDMKIGGKLLPAGIYTLTIHTRSDGRNAMAARFRVVAPTK